MKVPSLKQLLYPISDDCCKRTVNLNSLRRADYVLLISRVVVWM